MQEPGKSLSRAGDGVPHVSYAMSDSGSGAARVSGSGYIRVAGDKEGRQFGGSDVQASGPVSDTRSDWVVISRMACWVTQRVDSRGRPDSDSNVGLESLLLAEGAQSRRVMRVGYTVGTGRVLYEDCMISYASIGAWVDSEKASRARL